MGLYRVYNNIRFGLLKSVYEKCLLIELRKAGLHALPQKPSTVYYAGEVAGDYVVDIIVNDEIILELKLK